MNSFHRFAWIVFISCIAIMMVAQEGIPPYSAELLPVHYLPTGSFIQSGLDEDASKWGVYTDGLGTPTWAMENVSTPSLDGKSLRCAITGGEPYSNVHCYRNLPAIPSSNTFALRMSFLYRPVSTFNNVGGDSIVQGLEFTMNKWDQGLRYEWAVQWDNVDVGAPKWRYWDPSQASPWVDLGISGSVSGEEWHTLLLEGRIHEGQLEYFSFLLDSQGVVFLFPPPIAPVSTPGELDRLAVAVQLDGNYKETPYELFIDQVSLEVFPPFGDVPVAYWAYDHIERLYNAGITGGCMTNPQNYCPENAVTRAQMAVFLERGLHYPASFTAPDVPPTFNDTVGHWAEDWIEALKNDGITAGCAEGLYCPENPVTRAQMAVFLLKAKHGSSYMPPAVGTNTGFDDVPTDHWAAAWIKQLAAEQITGGCGGGNYCPESPVTRAQMAVFLVKTFGLP